MIRQELDSALLKLKAAMGRNIAHQFKRRRGPLEQVVIERTEMGGRLGPRAPYGEIQERGGEIQGPQGRAADDSRSAIREARGIVRDSAGAMISSPSSFGYESSFTSPQMIVFGKHGQEAEPLLLLRRSVTLPPRPYAEPALVEGVGEERLLNAR